MTNNKDIFKEGKSSSVPKTSTTMLHQLGSDAGPPRWTEFAARYRPMMERYLATHFPSLESNDVIQETLIALVKILSLTNTLRKRQARSTTASPASCATRLCAMKRFQTVFSPSSA